MSTFKSKAILLRKLNYSESSIIADFYTLEKGLRSFIVSGVRTKGKRNKSAYFQYGNILEIVAYDKDSSQLSRIKEYKLALASPKNLSHVVRGSLIMFMIELSRNVIKDREPDEELFQYLEEWLLNADRLSSDALAMMPIAFALHLCRYMGIFPLNDYSASKPYFNLSQGSYLMNNEHASTINAETSEHISELLSMNPYEILEARLNKATRVEVLDKILDYYSIQMPQFSELKTVPILRTIF